jgi:hypothetical protein
MQNVPHFLFQIVSINEGLVRCSFDISTQATGILQCFVALVFLHSRCQRGVCQPVEVKCIEMQKNYEKERPIVDSFLPGDKALMNRVGRTSSEVPLDHSSQHRLPCREYLPRRLHLPRHHRPPNRDLVVPLHLLPLEDFLPRLLPL